MIPIPAQARSLLPMHNLADWLFCTALHQANSVKNLSKRQQADGADMAVAEHRRSWRMKEQPGWRLRRWRSGCASSWPHCVTPSAGSSAPPRSASRHCKPAYSLWPPAWYAPATALIDTIHQWHLLASRRPKKHQRLLWCGCWLCLVQAASGVWHRPAWPVCT